MGLFIMSVKCEEYPDCENNNSDPDAHLWITNCLMSENEKDPMIKDFIDS